jgi:hypothetical protein
MNEMKNNAAGNLDINKCRQDQILIVNISIKYALKDYTVTIYNVGGTR